MYFLTFLYFISYVLVLYYFSYDFISLFSDPINVSASAPGDFQINVSWDRPHELHSFINFTENATTISTWDAVKVKLNSCFLINDLF